VRGSDNSVYINTTFSGRQSAAGAIFMDARCVKGFDEPVCIIYGHNMKNGAMFATLEKYLNPSFIDTHPVITVTKPDGGELTYRIAEVTHTDAWDEAYDLSAFNDDSSETPGALGDAPRRLLLSTCLRGAGQDARLLIQASLVERQE